MSEQKKFINTTIISIRWTDLDAYNHVGNQRYFDYMTEARAQIFKIFPQNLPNHLYVLVDTRCNFKKSFTYPGTALVHQYLLSIGNTSFELTYTFEDQNKPDQICAEGYAKLVCVDSTTQRAVRIPDRLRTYLETLSS